MAPQSRAEGQRGQEGRKSCPNPREGQRPYSALMPSVLESDQSASLSSQEKASQLCTGPSPVLWASVVGKIGPVHTDKHRRIQES